MNSDYGSLPFEMKGYSKPKTPLHQKALYIVAVLAMAVIWFTR